MKICEELAVMTKMRAAAEEDYAKALQKIAARSEGLVAEQEEEAAKATLAESFESLRADLLNKAVQVS